MNSLCKWTFVCLLICSRLTVSVEGQCSLPVSWQSNFYLGYGNGLPNVLAVNATSLSDLISGYTSTCNAFNETAGLISLTQVKDAIKEQYCSEIMPGKNVFFYRTSNDVFQDNPLTLEECIPALGARTQFKAYVRFLDTVFDFATWGTDIIPDGTYSFTYTAGTTGSCTDTNAKLTISNNVWSASSTCITGDQSYINPMAGDLLAVDGLQDADLSVVSTSPNSGMLVLAMPFPNSLIFFVTHKFILARYQVMSNADQTSYLNLFFTVDEAADPTGYLNVNAIPVSARDFLVTTTITSNECSTVQCLNGGTCIQQWLSFTCSCPPGFEGTTCDTNINECSSNPCQNGGTCNDKVNGFKCLCPGDFDGTTCQLPSACGSTNPCQNGATCTTVSNNGKPPEAFCLCPTKYYGDNCEFLDQCADEPCENGGTCFIQELTDYFCFCPMGLSGKRCEINNGTTCEIVECNNGVCLENDVGAYCECDIFFDGDRCDRLSDWFIVALVLASLLVIIIIILLIVCCCFCCCGWRPNSTANYETMNNSESSFKMDPPPSNPGTVEFNFNPASPYYGIQMMGSRN